MYDLVGIERLIILYSVYDGQGSFRGGTHGQCAQRPHDERMVDSVQYISYIHDYYYNTYIWNDCRTLEGGALVLADQGYEKWKVIRVKLILFGEWMYVCVCAF